MTIEINLLPWRERQRIRRSRYFHLALVGAVLLGGAGGWGLTCYYDSALDAQHERNAHIRQRMQQLDGEIRSLGEYEAKRERMIGQVRVFSDLQQGRSQTVRVFRDLTLSLVDGVHYTQLSRQGDQLRLSGRAESNHRCPSSCEPCPLLRRSPSRCSPRLSPAAVHDAVSVSAWGSSARVATRRKAGTNHEPAG
ncbi:PilN domain-containing protein [Billgrantia tianxiuensis]|uniref:PilN domain-containing protein n=1 Tax=Billgrantia tianxiuensis TaxID=2497861 RepID=UPI001F4756CF|nr:fimbrial assembly protein [Halomonas tianxiuensis]